MPYYVCSFCLPCANLCDVPFPIPEGSIAGGAAGVVVETALYPIDTIKTRLQVCSLVSVF
jgi:hypothetical protein